MKIVDLKTTILAVPFKKQTVWPYGQWNGMTVIVIELETDEGIIGIGESLAEPSPAKATEAYIQRAKPLLIGENPFDTERLTKKMEGFGGWALARQMAGHILGGIDMALWDIIGKACKQPVYNLLGGKIRDRAEFFRYVPHDEPEAMARDAKLHVDKGYSTIYCKYSNIEHLTDALTAIRSAIGMEPRLWVDFNQTLSVGFTLAYLKELEHLRIDIIEQPVLAADLAGMAQIRKATSARLLAHESSMTLYEAMATIKAEAADIISIEPRMTWGMLGAKKGAALAEAAGMPALIHSSAELGVAMAAFLHILVSTPNMILPNQGMYDWYADDYIKEGVLTYEGASLRVPDGPGLGVELDRDKMALYHELYLKEGDYGSNNVDPDSAGKILVPLWPSY